MSKPGNKNTVLPNPPTDLPSDNPPETDAPAPLVDTELNPFAGGETPEQEAKAEAESLVEEDLEALPTKLAAPPAPVDPSMNDIVSVAADKNLRVVTNPDQEVFTLTVGVTRQLPKRLALAAQMSGAAQGVIVTITAAE